MAEQMAGWGPDGLHTITAGSAALGHALLIVTHESRFEKMPFRDEEEKITFTAAARLDNRDELCDLFSIPHPERPVTSDGRLAYLAYKKWGRDACKKLYGDWSFAAWHAKEKRLFLARDHLGNTGLYYYFKPPLVVFASCPPAVLASPPVPRILDEQYFAQKLLFLFPEESWQQTYWKDVRFLPAAHYLTACHTDVQVDHYWRIEDVPSVRLGSDGLYLERFLELYRQAVNVRLNSIRPVGSTLSAGLDSSSVTALAAQAMAKTNQTLTAFTAVPRFSSEEIFPDRLTDEWPLAHQVADLFANITHVAISSEEITPLDAIFQILKITCQPQHAASNMTWILSILEDARRRNLGVLLTGQMGNGTVSWSGGRDYIFHLFSKRKWLKGLKALKERKTRNGFSCLKVVKNQILRPILLPVRFEYQVLKDRSGKEDLSYSFPNREFIMQVNPDAMSAKRLSSRPLPPISERKLIVIRNGTNVGRFWPLLASFYGLDVRDPTSDIRLIEFCLGIPDEQCTASGGQRMLIRRAMAGILPDTVRWNTARGRQSSDIMLRLLDQKDDISRALDLLESSSDIKRYLDTKAMRAAWNSIIGQAAHPTVANSLLRSINQGFFILDLYPHCENSIGEK